MVHAGHGSVLEALEVFDPCTGIEDHGLFVRTNRSALAQDSERCVTGGSLGGGQSRQQSSRDDEPWATPGSNNSSRDNDGWSAPGSYGDDTPF